MSQSLSRVLQLNRELIQAAHPTPLSDDEFAMRLLDEAAIRASFDAAMADAPQADALWLFAYGSLMWNPALDFTEERVGILHGWHRRFCLWQWRYRANRQQPGLMLALDRGGSCKGVVYQVTGPELWDKVAVVWRREMSADGYRPRWVTVRTPQGSVPAVVFVAHRAGERYAGRLPANEVARYIASACGGKGPSAEYLLETVSRCEALGIHDRLLWQLQQLVAEELQARLGGQNY